MPRSVLIYGLLGVLPFLIPPLAAFTVPATTELTMAILALYAALILSFLGGARWGLANAHPAPSARTITLSMLPSLCGLGLLLLPPDLRRPQLILLAVALALHWLWDVSGNGLPTWYPGLRTILTAGALIGLAAGAAIA
jgi:hypothetical protein